MKNSPVLRASRITSVYAGYSNAATRLGALAKTAALLVFLAAPFLCILTGMATISDGELLVAVVGGTIVAFVIVFLPKNAPWLAPIYTFCEGIALGAITLRVEQLEPGIGAMSAGLTILTLIVMAALYSRGIVKVTDRFRSVTIGATGVIALAYLLNLGLFFFTGIELPYLHEASAIGILIQVAIIVAAAMNLLLDFDFIDTMEAKRAPKYFEWYAAFGLVLTLVWLYVEFLRLLSLKNR